MNTAGKVDQFLDRIEQALIMVFLTVMVGLSFLQVVLRLFFSTSILWGDVFLRHLVLWVGFLGAAEAASEGHHFTIDLVKKILPDSFRKPVFYLINSLASIGLLYLSGAALEFFRDEFSAKSVLFSVGSFRVPSYWMTASIPFGFLLLLVHFILHTLAGPPDDVSRLEI